MGKLDEALRRAERSSRQFLPFFKFPIGKTDLRVLPAAVAKGDTEEDWFLPVGLHYNLNDKQPVVCRAETNWAAEACPICAAVTELRAAGQNDEAQRIGLRKQYLVRAIVRGQEEKGAQIIRLPTTVFQDVGKIIQDQELFGDVLSPSPKGRDIRVIKSGTGLSTAYSVQALPRTNPALPTPSETKAVMEKLSSIFTLADIPTENEVEALVQSKLGFSVKGGGGFGDSPDDDDAGGDWGDGDTVSGKEVVDDDEDWGQVSTPPFEPPKSAEKEGPVAPASDDSWLDDDVNTDTISFAEVLNAKKEQLASPSTQVSGLTAGLNKALEGQTVSPEQRKRGKSRTRPVGV